MGGETISYTIIDLTADTEFTVRVIATREHADDGAPSEEVTATPVSADPDVNGNGVLDGNDALILHHSYASAAQLGDGETGGTAQSRQSLLMYYAFTTANLVGDGETGGTARFRQLPVAAFANKDNPTDEDLKAISAGMKSHHASRRDHLPQGRLNIGNTSAFRWLWRERGEPAYQRTVPCNTTTFSGFSPGRPMRRPNSSSVSKRLSELSLRPRRSVCMPPAALCALK